MPAYYNDTIQALLFKACTALKTVSSADMTPYFNDTVQTLVYKMDMLIAGIATVPSPNIATPSSDTDFSGLPGGVAPAGGTGLIYYAVRDAFTYWTIGAGDTEWRVINKDSV